MARASTNTPVVFGRYRLLRRIGLTATEEIFVGQEPGPGEGRAVLVRRLLPNLSKNRPTVNRFLDEARTQSVLGHPSIPHLLDAGEDGGTYASVTELLPGAELTELLELEAKKGVPLPVNVALRILDEVLSALAHAHRAEGDDGRPLHLVHRDVTPRSVRLGYDGAVQLGGFGLARHESRSEETSSGVVRGLIAYLAPEQLVAGPLDGRTDLWAAGLLLHELLTGTRFYERQSEFHSFKAIRDEAVPAPSELRPELPLKLDDLVLRAVERDVDARFPDAEAMRAELQQVARAVGGMADRAELAAYTCTRLAERLGRHRAAAQAGRLGLQPLLEIVGGAVVGEPVEIESTDPAPQKTTEPTELPRPPRELAREVAAPRGRPPEPTDPPELPRPRSRALPAAEPQPDTFPPRPPVRRISEVDSAPEPPPRPPSRKVPVVEAPVEPPRPPSRKVPVVEAPVEPPRPPSRKVPVVESEPESPRAPSRKLAAVAPPEPRPSSRSVEAEPRRSVRERPVMPEAPPPLAIPQARPAKAAKKNKKRRRPKRFRLVEERGLNPLIHPLALGVAVVLGMGTVRNQRLEKPVEAAQLVETGPAAIQLAPPASSGAGGVKPAAGREPAPAPSDESRPLKVEERLTLDDEPETQLMPRGPKPLGGTLRVDAPHGSQLYVDGETRAVGSALALKAGKHQVRVVGPGGASRSFAVEVAPGRTVAKSVSFAEAPSQPKVEEWK